MDTLTVVETFSYLQRIDCLRDTKLAQTREKQNLVGSMDHDDHGLILPPQDRREIVQTMSSSGMPIVDCLLKGFSIQSNHPSGGFFGAKACGSNFRRLLESHPPYIDPVSSLAGGYMVNFMSYRKPHWKPEFDFNALRDEIARYKLLPGIGAAQHFCQDLAIGLRLGWGGILENIQAGRGAHPDKKDFYDGLEDVVRGIQNWISRTAVEAAQMAQKETNPALKTNLEEMAAINQRLVCEIPANFRDACQWILWYQISARMYNGSGSMGRLDVILEPFYKKDMLTEKLSDPEAIFHIACLLLRDTAYLQLGGPDASGKDVTSHLSYLILEAAHQLKIPANVGVAVGDSVDPGLVRRGVEVMFEDRTGIPKFLGDDQTAVGFARNGYPKELGWERAYSGCHWSGIPGREYTMNDCVKINFAAIFEFAFNEMMADKSSSPSTSNLWERFTRHLKRGVDVTAMALDYHMAHMAEVFPELVLDLLCYGPLERGLDASQDGVEFYNLCIDGAALATVADSFAALEQRVEKEGRLTWEQINGYMASNWSGSEGEKVRLMMHSVPHYGSGQSSADGYAVKISQTFTCLVKENKTPSGFNMIPGLFSWANTIPMGKEIGATPNGRRAGQPITQGSNPEPGFRKDGAPTALAVAIASVQPGYGNTAPMQLELDPTITRDEEAVDNVTSLITSHFQLGGTQINLNLLDTARILEAHKDPSKYPDLIVRVTGFSAYFASLSPEFRQLVVDRIISG